MNKILVVGGAGYIGSHMVKLLLKEGLEVTVFDNLSTGYRDAVIGGEFIQGALANTKSLDKLFKNRKFDAVMHFASFIEVRESVTAPGKYYINNVSNTIKLLEAMVKHNINNFIFSSTAAVFGQPDYTPIDEKHPKQPINPYGMSKLMVENILKDFDHAHGLKSVCLRYFNAAGADPEGELGERHDPETHLIPLVLQTAAKRRPSISIFGDDYETPDGTCVRDYVHISDLCDAHLLALKNLIKTRLSDSFNLGNGSGFSVKEVIDTATKVTGKEIKVVNAAGREGDPAILVADSKRAQSQLGWKPKYSDLGTIIEHAWKWECKHFASPAIQTIIHS